MRGTTLGKIVSLLLCCTFFALAQEESDLVVPKLAGFQAFYAMPNVKAPKNAMAASDLWIPKIANSPSNSALLFTNAKEKVWVIVWPYPCLGWKNSGIDPDSKAFADAFNEQAKKNSWEIRAHRHVRVKNLTGIEKYLLGNCPTEGFYSYLLYIPGEIEDVKRHKYRDRDAHAIFVVFEPEGAKKASTVTDYLVKNLRFGK